MSSDVERFAARVRRRLLYGDHRDGQVDPGGLTGEERHRLSEARAVAERERAESPSPAVRALAAASRKALGRTR